ncbi:MAG: transcription elongation factor GreA [Cytophagales bacterium]|nr:transcription elongation factor GreA [Cytophagales bacterium]
MKEVLLSSQGYEKILRELTSLQEERQHVLEQLNIAREMGDLSENAEYDAAKKTLREIDAKIMRQQDIIRNANIITPPSEDRDVVNILAYFTLKSLDNGNELSYQMVSIDEANIQEKKISPSSPLGEAIFKKKNGDIISYEAPIGILKFKIIDVHYDK